MQSAVEGASSTIRSILRQPKGAVTLQKAPTTPTVETQVQLCAGDCGSGGKAAFCLRRLHKVCSVSIWVSRAIRLLLSTNFFFLSAYRRK